ncbi:2-dehydropantoate 2-reductase [Lederbergia sp. NSJ-179]|uniref:2-dehydropantoate 2-reductase n=1 Tax=Lederbergia sp. NSJ-179 TaxID=2931402 RepID=UPI001FD3C4C6|nr:2-dehydropantoate 2-reductase [Lederbergia sp. NSJ-179]MCJ7839542.1 2-dehydropantoate 2-reductase [Lederbergia sp. NSJ-179]
MKIGIIGGGAVGLLFGAFLSLNHEVSIFTRTKAQANVLNKKGIILAGSQANARYSIKASDNVDRLGSQDFVVIAVKQYDLESLLPLLLDLPAHLPLLFIQNGIGHLEIIKELPHETIFIGTVEHGVKRVDLHQIVHTGVGVTNIAVYKGLEDAFISFPKSSSDQFPFVFHKDYKKMIFSKLMANSVINPLTTIFNVKNGSLVENPHFYRLLKKLHAEICSVFPEIESKQSLEKIEHICKNTKDNFSSMLVDMREGRKTEIEAILGEVICRAKKKEIALPFAAFVFEIIKGMERERDLKGIASMF